MNTEPLAATATPPRLPRQPLTISEQAHGTFKSGTDVYRVPSSSVADLYRTVNLARETCSCPGFGVARKHGHPCRHIHAAYLHVAAALLKIEGEPKAADFDDAMRHLLAGRLAYRYLCDGGNSPRYGKVPNRTAGVEWSIGLRPEARRDLTAVERRACCYALRAMAEQSQWHDEPAERAA